MTYRKPKPIALVGLMGSGKTEVARIVGERLGASVADVDAMIEGAEGARVAELFARQGETWFRRREAEMLGDVLDAGVRVIACGGGAVLEPASRKRLHESCRVVWLRVSPAEAARRVTAASPDAASTRPLLAGGAPEVRLTELLAARASLYAEVAHVVVDTDGLTPDAVADAVLAARSAAA